MCLKWPALHALSNRTAQLISCMNSAWPAFLSTLVLNYCFSFMDSQQIESLQRECDECAAELQRYRHSDAGRLPSVLTRPVSLQDELDNLKR
jgi:hypothetical protein